MLAKDVMSEKVTKWGHRLAQSLEHTTLGLKVMNSSPTSGAELT